jgi:predicted dithiol-disulfide oxidoreductase (DUF899 family)
MTLPRIAGRDEWRAARIALLEKEKEFTRARDALNTERRNLPMVEIEKDYVFDGTKGPAHLLDLFDGRSQKRGWDIPWYSSFGSDFNYDFCVTIDESKGVDEYNFRSKAEYEARGDDFFDYDQPFEMPGRSCFLHVDGRVFHTYSQYARGLESTGGSYYFLDLTALGRQEDWEEPKGRSQSVRTNTPDFAS